MTHIDDKNKPCCLFEEEGNLKIVKIAKYGTYFFTIPAAASGGGGGGGGGKPKKEGGGGAERGVGFGGAR